MKKTTVSAMVLSVGVGVFLCAALPVAAGQGEFTEDFPLDDCSFSDSGRNPYFSLEVGDQLIFESEDDEEQVRLKITVLAKRKLITFETDEGETLKVCTRVVEEREWVNGKLFEVSRNYFARCQETNDIYYFGEDVDFYENGVIVGHDGSWRAGLDDALPGLIMPGSFLLGSRYFQELAPDVALDQAEHVEMGLEVEVPAGEFEDCVEILETTPLEPGSESTKVYCAEVGLVIDNDAQLVSFDIGEEEAESRSDRYRPTR